MLSPSRRAIPNRSQKCLHYTCLKLFGEGEESTPLHSRVTRMWRGEPVLSLPKDALAYANSQIFTFGNFGDFGNPPDTPLRPMVVEIFGGRIPPKDTQRLQAFPGSPADAALGLIRTHYKRK
jgi:hypothetical protein